VHAVGIESRDLDIRSWPDRADVRGRVIPTAGADTEESLCILLERRDPRNASRSTVKAS